MFVLTISITTKNCVFRISPVQAIVGLVAEVVRVCIGLGGGGKGCRSNGASGHHPRSRHCGKGARMRRRERKKKTLFTNGRGLGVSCFWRFPFFSFDFFCVFLVVFGCGLSPSTVARRGCDGRPDEARARRVPTEHPAAAGPTSRPPDC